MRRTLLVPTSVRERLYDWLHGSSTGLLALALLIGAGTGIGAVVFRYLIVWFTLLFSGQADYSAAGHAGHPLLPVLGAAFVVLVPILGGLIYGPLVDRFAREARGHACPK